jgi:hypothetical protein
MAKIAFYLTLLYSSIISTALVTIGFFSSEISDTRTVFLMIPVALFYLIMLSTEVSGILRTHKLKIVQYVLGFLNLYSFGIVGLMIIASLAASSTIVQASYTLILAPLYSPFIISFIQTYLKLKKRLRSILNIRGPTKKPITVATKVTNNHLEETEDNHRELETTQDLTEITSGEIVSEETIFSSVQDNQKDSS